MASIEKYQNVAGETRYRVRFRDLQRRQTARRFRTLREAKAFAAQVSVSVSDGTYVSPTAGKVAVGELVPGWLERRQGHLKPSAYRVLETSARLHVLPRWRDVRIGDIVPSAVQAWTSGMTAQGKGAVIVIRAFGVLAGVLDDAVRDGILARNPARGAKLPRKPRKPHVYLTHDQVRDFVREAGEYGHGTLILTLAYTGLRWSEATALRPRDLDLFRKTITVSRNAVRGGGVVVVGTPKSNRTRTVPIPALLLAPLARQCAGIGRDDLLFPNGDGGYLRAGKWWEASRRKAALPRVTPHDLRATCAALAVQAGASVKALQALLGHTSAAMTLDIYAGLFADDLTRVAEQMDAAAKAPSVQIVHGTDSGREVI